MRKRKLLFGTSRRCYGQNRSGPHPASELEFVSDFVRMLFVTHRLRMVLNGLS